jgi:hypothetical protein
MCMAQKMLVSFVDDLDGSEAEGTVAFSLSGRDYEIDLSEANAAKLRDVLAPFVAAGRKAGGNPRAARRASTVSSTSTPRANREDGKAIRDWALAQGLSVSTRGRISAEVLEAYKTRDNKPTVTEPVAVEPEQAAPVKKTRSRAKIKQPEFSGAK